MKLVIDIVPRFHEGPGLGGPFDEALNWSLSLFHSASTAGLLIMPWAQAFDRWIFVLSC